MVQLQSGAAWREFWLHGFWNVESVTVVLQLFPSSLQPYFSKALSKIQKELQWNINGTLAIHEQQTTSGLMFPCLCSSTSSSRTAASESFEGDESSMFNILHKLSADITAGKDEKS